MFKIGRLLIVDSDSIITLGKLGRFDFLGMTGLKISILDAVTYELLSSLEDGSLLKKNLVDFLTSEQHNISIIPTRTGMEMFESLCTKKISYSKGKHHKEMAVRDFLDKDNKAKEGCLIILEDITLTKIINALIDELPKPSFCTDTKKLLQILKHKGLISLAENP